MDDSDLFAAPHRRPSLTRPLLGLTILVIEDSRYACDAMRLMCLHSGARIRRADCLKSACRHLQVYRPSVVIVDLGLPDGSGAELIENLAAATPRISAILGTSGDDFAESVALAAGADGFLEKPLSSLAAFQEKILSALPPDLRPHGPRPLVDEAICPDPMAYRDDMAHVADLLTEPRDERVLDYAAQFVNGVARAAKDHVLADAAQAVARSRKRGAPVGAETARLAGLVQNRLERREAI
ncbi:response regulator [Ruegeria marisrubri]|uniref:Response regulator n=1 Tax=Ruegeria marisrubri TaxID=1685379 RepID=A0A0X3TE15_9RHOB|nr:response regulator [Ruegeria marisrubri]KUJ73351.1 response regulator [Ruegeria marisrubri]